MKPGDPGRHTVKHERHFCVLCKRSVTINVDGRFRAHNLPSGRKCPNSLTVWLPPVPTEEVRVRPLPPMPKVKPRVDLGPN